MVINVIFYEWSRLASGVTQGSVLGPIRFNLFINDTGVGINSSISMFSDYTKLSRETISQQDTVTLQLVIIEEWAAQMRFGVENVK